MSHQSSSFVSADNTEIKYKKALKEITKLMAANRALRENSQKGNASLKDKIDELSLRYEDLEKQYEVCRKQKESLAQYLDQLQKQRNTLDRQVVYLNEVLGEQQATVRKYQLQNDEKAMANLIRSYQNKEALMNRNITQQEQIITRLKNHIQKQQNQISMLEEQKRNIEDKFNRSTMEISRYRQLNQSLMNQNQRILMEHSYKEEGLNEKEKEMEILANEFRSQINLLKSSATLDNNYNDNKMNENIEQLLGQKNRISVQYTKLREAYNQALEREKYYFEIEEKMKIANTKAERAVEEVNMLKSKIVVLEAKEFLEEAGDDDYDHKEFEERMAMMIEQNDPLNVLKNSDDSSHFRIMKSFLVDLQDKIYRINQQKIATLKKYKSVKHKFLKYAKQSAQFEQQNKLLKGKLEGYERLTQKLHFELQKALANHEDEVTRMSITSNNILSKKTEQYKNTIAFLNSQIQVGQQKLEKVGKNAKQENDTLKLELETLRIKLGDTSEKATKEKEFIEMFKKKNQELSSKVTRLEEELSEIKEASNRWERLFREQKTKGEGLITQKQQLIARNRQLVEELDKKTENYNESIKNKDNYSDTEIRRLTTEISHYKDELQYASRELQKLQRDLDERRALEENEVEQIKRISTRNSELQAKNNEYKKRIREIEDENETIKLKGKKYQQNYEKGAKVEQDLLSLNDKVNDLTRQKISLESQLKILQGQCDQERRQNDELKRQISETKLKSMDASHQLRKQLESKLLENKRLNQNLSQEISDLTAELREEKSKNLRYSNEISSLKSQKNRIQDNIEQNRKKDFQVQSQVGNLKIEISQLQLENQRLQNEMKNQNYNINNLNLELESFQQKIFSLNQEISSLKMKVETCQDEKNDLVRDLNSLKFNFSALDTYIAKNKGQASLKWEEESFFNSCSDVLNKIRKIGRLYGVTYETAASTIQNVPIEPVSNIQNKNIIGGASSYDYFKTYSKGDDSLRAHFDNNDFTRKPLQNNFESSQSFKLGSVSANKNQSYQSSNRRGNEEWGNPAYRGGAVEDFQFRSDSERRLQITESEVL